MILTAISVARNCGMVKPHEKVIIVNAHPPENGCPARVEWEQSESVSDDTPTDSDQEVKIIRQLRVTSFVLPPLQPNFLFLKLLNFLSFQKRKKLVLIFNFFSCFFFI